MNGIRSVPSLNYGLEILLPDSGQMGDKEEIASR